MSFFTKRKFESATELSKEETTEMLERMDEWVNGEVTPEQLHAVVFAMAMDEEFQALVEKAVAQERFLNLGG